MKSIVKHYTLQPDGSLVRLADEVHEYTPEECPCQPVESHVLSRRSENGRHTVVIAEHKSRAGRPVDPMKSALSGMMSDALERAIAERQYEGRPNEDDESFPDICPEIYGKED